MAAMLAAGASTGCYHSAHVRHVQEGNSGCPSSRGSLAALDTIGFLGSVALAAAPAYTDDQFAGALAAGTGGVMALLYGLSLLAAAKADCHQTPEQIAYAADAQACARGDAASCYAAALVADRRGLSGPAAAFAADTLFARACELGEPRACRLQGERRRLMQPDQAARYFARACELGDTESCGPEHRRDHEAEAQSGSCFFAADDVVVTNNHVVASGGTITVLDSQGRMHAATVARAASDVDLAALTVPTATGIVPLPIGRDASLGLHVFTIGFPMPSMLGVDPKFSEGSISGLSGLGLDWLYQVSVPVQPGNSGGPLVDDDGAVVGVVVAKLRADKVTAATGVAPENVNFAVKGAALRRFLADSGVSATGVAGPRADAIARVSAAVCQILVEAAPRGPGGAGPGPR
ncbi:MAG: trypsin-like peptidase domain-containing protein [Myxococcales bacterium]|nr:trypsin-like peptidase domain-containing protein [Myxococcales bacterium]